VKAPDIIEVALEVIKVFEDLNISYYIGGSLASSAFGFAHSTMDVDLVADIEVEHASILEESPKILFSENSCGLEQGRRSQAAKERCSRSDEGSGRGSRFRISKVLGGKIENS
jgi:hypothetical protein